ncbi:hypothetical protein M440DRAFT_1334688 [Trichoderma longibrachiatum ATCC 18648]|uniref:Actin-like ATPase domain-containing protein n=1 Tax=Trichoderma longibrachiatum ATCC 18648 TaxID=983965 RepID=A0A2T4C316_TRILO|nr:hypothetical protein M440DRAFT_1334688 [Trichoderma longibrachiatum ATCC 18648]
MEFDKLSITDRKIIVGIDFGTTYSGVAWAETQRPDRRTAITTWPISKTTREGESSDKVPTKLRYAKDEVQWGFSIPITAPQEEVIEWFKLDLDPSLKNIGQAVANDGARGGRDADKLVADYLGALCEHLLYTLREKLGESVVKSTPLEFVVTVPAIWSDLAKDKTKRACQKAVQSLPLAPGSSRTLIHLSKLGKEDGFDEEVLAEAMEVFEKKVKRQFTLAAQPDETYTIPVGGLANNKALGITRGRYALKASDLKTIFEPVVLEVIKLVKDQITVSNVPIRAVLLVGGFGASNYLKERLRNAVDKSIQIMQPPNAWQAVVQGAVMKGLANSAPDTLTMVKVQNRKARKHYGTEWRTKYDERIHGHMSEKKSWSGMEGYYKVNAMEWFIRKGDAVSENEPYITSFVWTGLVAHGRIRKMRMTIYCDQTSEEAPIDRNSNVQVLAHVEADVSHIPEHLLNRRQGKDGSMYYELSCKIEAVYLSASTTYTLLYNNQRYDTVTCEYV